MKIAPYIRLMRLHQPVGIWLLLWPAFSALALMRAPWTLYAAFAVGTVVMRSAGCVVNDLWDREIDARVERTKSRPLASGELRPEQAEMLLGALLVMALGLALYLGGQVVVWAVLALPLIVVYPVAKRLTWWPQAVLGLTFNWGALLASVAVTGQVTLPALLLYVGGIGWTLGYDTIYAHQDKVDDAAIGVRSTALRLGEATPRWLAGFYAFAIGCWVLAGWAAQANSLFFAMLTVVAAHFACQLRRLDMDSPTACRALFCSNAWAGMLLFVACWLGKFQI